MKPKLKELAERGKFSFLVALAITAMLVLGTTANAQVGAGGNYSTLKGVVTEKGTKAVPVEFAAVIVNPQGSAGMTDKNGEFNLTKLSPGKVKVRFQFLGMENLDTTVVLYAGKTTVLNVEMEYSSFRLKEVAVVAQESKAGQATASNISRQAMDHLQTSSLSDIMQLLPGGVTANPNLSTAKTISIRNLGGTANEMNSLGTSIIVDGAPISNNANMQALSPTISGGASAVGGGASPSSGIDLRTISTDNIESVEVISGIASVEYGDLTSGAVLIRSKAGREPLTIRFKTDPNTYQISVSKGMSLGGKAGNLNISGDYAYSVSKPTESYAYYQRATAKVLYSNVFGKLASNTSFDFVLGKDTREKNPDDVRSQLATGAKDITLRFNTNGTWNVNYGWLNNVKYTLSGSYANKHSFQEELLGNAFAAYSMSATDGAILSNRPYQRVYDINGVELTNIPSNETSYYATYLPNEYFSRYDIYGKEVNIFANVKANLTKTIGGVFNKIIIGADFKSDGNLGDGKVYDLKRPPYRNVSSENSSPRPRKFSDIPFVNQLSLYAEENLLYSFGERELSLQVGGRYDVVADKSALTYRLNGSFDLIPRYLTLRAGHGLLAKAPTALYLYPENAYFDFVHYNTLGSSTIPESEQLLLASTRIFNTENKDLEMAINTKSEVGFDFKIKKMRFSFTGFYDRMNNGYNLGSDFSTFKLIEYTQYKAGITQPGHTPKLDFKSKNNIFVNYAKPMNNIESVNKGVEMAIDLGRFEELRTSFYINGAYTRSSSWNNGHSFSSKKNLNSLEKNIGVYEKAVSKEEDERLTTTFRATHNIPSIGFVLTLSAEVKWINKYWSTYGNDTMFVSYISRENGQVLPFDPSKKDDPEFSYMFDSKNPRRYIVESVFPTVIFNFHLSKEIGKNMRASFYANNMFNCRPLYENKMSPGSFTRLNIPMYFGFELSVKL